MGAVIRVAVIIDVRRAYRREIVRGVHDYSRQAGNWYIYVDPFADVAQPEYVNVAGCDGVIVSATRPGVTEAIAAKDIPAVNVSPTAGETGMASVVCDYEMAGRLAARHLMDCGLRRLSFLAEPSRVPSDLHIAGIQQEIKDRGADCMFDVVYATSQPHEKWMDLQGRLERWLQETAKPLGVIGTNDTYTRRLACACKRLGLRVPEDVALVGVNNESVVCDLSDPPLSSVDLSWWQVGHKAASVLAGLMSGQAPPDKPIVIPPAGVVARASSDVLAVSDDTVTRAATFIRRHAIEGVTVADVARAVSVSRRSLELRFARCLGRSPNAEILRVRVERAKEMLARTSVPLASLAKACGFSDRRAMSNAFRKCVGAMPSEYRLRYSHHWAAYPVLADEEQ